MQSDAPSLLSPDGSFKDRSLKLWLAAAAAAAAVIAAAGWGMGIFSDDPLNFQTAEALTWAQILTLRNTPIPLHMALCKLALLVAPGDPAGFLRLCVIPGHLFSGYLLWRLLEKHVRPRTAFAASLVFLLYRAGTEGIFWSGASTKEVYMQMFALLALYIWTGGAAGSRTGGRWLAVLPAAGAVLSKPNGIVVVPLIFACELLFPERQKSGPASDQYSDQTGGGRLGWLAPFAALSVVCGALTVNARLNPGYYASYTKVPLLSEGWFYFSEFLHMLAVQLVPMKRIPVNLCAAVEETGLYVLFLLLAGFFWKRRDYLFAFLWMWAFMVPPVVLTGIYGYRYSYATGAGAIWLLAIGYDRLAGLGRHGPKLAAAAGIVWLAANCILYVDDVRTYRAAGQLGVFSRDLILRHKDELPGLQPVLLVSDGIILPPIPGPNRFFLQYYLDRPVLPVEHSGSACPQTREIPCVELHLSFENVRNCYPDRMEACIRWLDANASPGDPSGGSPGRSAGTPAGSP